MLNKKIAIAAALPLFALVLSGCSLAKNTATDGNKNQAVQQTNGGQDNSTADNSNSKKLPAEVLAACQGKAEGDSCETTMPAPPARDGSVSDTSSTTKITGTCKKAPQEDQLICMGANGQGGPGGSGQPGARPGNKN